MIRLGSAREAGKGNVFSGSGARHGHYALQDSALFRALPRLF